MLEPKKKKKELVSRKKRRLKETLPGAQTTSVWAHCLFDVGCLQRLAVYNAGDVDIAACIDVVVVVEGGRVVAAVSSVLQPWEWCGTTFRLVCKHDEWSVRSLTVYKPLLFIFPFLGHVPSLF